MAGTRLMRPALAAGLRGRARGPPRRLPWHGLSGPLLHPQQRPSAQASAPQVAHLGSSSGPATRCSPARPAGGVLHELAVAGWKPAPALRSQQDLQDSAPLQGAPPEHQVQTLHGHFPPPKKECSVLRRGCRFEAIPFGLHFWRRQRRSLGRSPGTDFLLAPHPTPLFTTTWC